MRHAGLDTFLAIQSRYNHVVFRRLLHHPQNIIPVRKAHAETPMRAR